MVCKKIKKCGDKRTGYLGDEGDRVLVSII